MPHPGARRIPHCCAEVEAIQCCRSGHEVPSITDPTTQITNHTVGAREYGAGGGGQGQQQDGAQLKPALGDAWTSQRAFLSFSIPSRSPPFQARLVLIPLRRFARCCCRCCCAKARVSLLPTTPLTTHPAHPHPDPHLHPHPHPLCTLPLHPRSSQARAADEARGRRGPLSRRRNVWRAG